MASVSAQNSSVPLTLVGSSAGSTTAFQPPEHAPEGHNATPSLFLSEGLSLFSTKDYIDPYHNPSVDSLDRREGSIVILRGAQTPRKLRELVTAVGADQSVLQHHISTLGTFRKSRPLQPGRHITIRFISIGLFRDQLAGLWEPGTPDYDLEKSVQDQLTSRLGEHHLSSQQAGREEFECFRSLTVHSQVAFTVEQQLTLSASVQGEHSWSGLMLSDFGNQVGKPPWSTSLKGFDRADFLSPYDDAPLSHAPEQNISLAQTRNVRAGELLRRLSDRPGPCRGKTGKTLTDPMDFFSFAADLLLTSSACWAQALGVLRHTLDAMPDDPKVLIFRLNRALEVLDRAERYFVTVRRFLHSHPTSAGHGSHVRLVSEFSELQEDTSDLVKWCRDAHGVALSQVNIEMAQQSLAEGARIKTITYLAFFFVPMTLVASLFGMNVQELSEQRQPSMWLYFAAAAPVTLLTFLFTVFISGGLADLRKSLTLTRPKANTVLETA